MKETFAPLAMAGVFIAGISTASAGLITPGMMDDFQDGKTAGWTNGARVLTEHPSHVENDGGNYYLSTEALGTPGKGKPPHNRRMTVFNASYDWSNETEPGLGPHTSKWAGDYTDIIKVEGKAMASGDDTISLRLGLGNFNLGAGGLHSDGVYYISNTVFEIATDSVWNDFSFDLKASDFVETPLNDPTGVSFDDLIKNVDQIRFVSNQDVIFFGGDDVKAVLGLDDIKAVGTTVVPLPGAVWLMISGLLGLSGLSSYKRSKV